MQTTQYRTALHTKPYGTPHPYETYRLPKEAQIAKFKIR